MPSRGTVERLRRAEFAALGAARLLTQHPAVQSRYLSAKHRRNGNLLELADAYGVPAGVLAEEINAGRDNPSYRFARDGGFFRWIRDHAEDLRHASWLDVGADTGAVSHYLSSILASEDFQLCDISVPERTAYPVRRFDGQRLDVPDNSFDFVIFSYVLHHAADKTIGLLSDAARVARRYIMVLEDPLENSKDLRWARYHAPSGTFRTLHEWRELFGLMQLDIVHEEPLSDDVHSRHFFLLRVQ